MEFAGALVGALIAVLGAFLVGVLLFRYQQRALQRREDQWLVSELIADLERNAYQFEGESMRIESSDVWRHSGMETRAWWGNRAKLYVLEDSLRSRLQDCVYELDDLNRVLADLRKADSSTLDRLGNRPVSSRFDDSRLRALRTSNQQMVRELREIRDRLS